MKILVSGGTGFVGKNLILRLLEKKHDVFLIGRSSSNFDFLKNKKVTVYKFDDDINKLMSFMKKEQFDGVIHLASFVITNHESKDIDSLIKSNILFPNQLLEAAAKNNVPWFINTGTYWQHFKNKKYSPVNLYAATKQAFEDIAQYYIETSKTKFITIKLCDNFGPLDSRKKIFNLWLDILRTGKKLEMSPGKQILDVSYIDNIIDGYLQLIKLISQKNNTIKSGTVFSINSKEKITLKDFAYLVENISKKKLNINWGGKNYRDREVMLPKNVGLKIPGWKQKISLKEGVRISLKKEGLIK